MALTKETLLNICEKHIQGLKIKASREYNPMIKQLISEEITQIEAHIADIKKKGA